MKMLIAILNADDASAVIQNLMKEGYSVTRLSTTGGLPSRRQRHDSHRCQR